MPFPPHFKRHQWGNILLSTHSLLPLLCQMIESQWIWSDAPKYRVHKTNHMLLQMEENLPLVVTNEVTLSRLYFLKLQLFLNRRAGAAGRRREQKDLSEMKKGQRGMRRKRGWGGCGQLKICQRLYNSEIRAKRTVKKPARRA